MSEDHTINIPAHPNIYTGGHGRELRIDFCIPQEGVNKNTGLLIFVPGFGGNIDSKVYKKMRGIFADKYNVVTIQCDYFGNKFMQDVNSFNVDKTDLRRWLTVDEIKLIELDTGKLEYFLKGKNAVLHNKYGLNETIDEFNDMSFMQAIDILTAVETVKVILKDNNLNFNSERTIGYGHSHGAYLLHLSNILSPDIYSLIIDNSAWVEPAYLYSNRYLHNSYKGIKVVTEIEYLGKNLIINKKCLHLKKLYNSYTGSTQIITFQGDNDHLVNHLEKRGIIENISNSTFILVTKYDVDRQKYKSNTHGLEADFLKLFDYALSFENPKTNSMELEKDYMVHLDGVKVNINNSEGLPVFEFSFSS